MTLSPSEVEQKTFSTALRGYDLDEVDDFLDEVVATIRELTEQIASGTPPVPAAVETAETETQVAPTPDESAVGRALVAAQETADRIIAEAREEAERIVADARDEADTLTSEREQRRAEAEEEMTELAELVAGVRSKLAVLATAVADRLDEMDAAISSVPGSGSEEGEPEETGSAEADFSDGEGEEEFTLEDVDDSHDEEADEGSAGASPEDEESSGTTW